MSCIRRDIVQVFIPSRFFASADIRAGDHDGSQTIRTSASLTPGTFNIRLRSFGDHAAHAAAGCRESHLDTRPNH